MSGTLPRAPTGPHVSSRDPPTLALAAVLVLGLVVRAQATLVPDLIVGYDGAYYLIQVRAILRDGHLAVPDFPLLFYFQAALAALFSLFLEQSAAIVAAVRWVDTLVPLLLAIPVYLFARAFATGRSRASGAWIAVLLVGGIAVASGRSLGMAGGVIKNATAVPFAFLFAFYLHQWLGQGTWRTLALATLCFLTSSLTHFGGLVLSASTGVLILATALLTPATRTRSTWPGVALLTGLGAVVGLVRILDPDRAHRLLHALRHPGWLFADSPVVQWLGGNDTLIQDAVFTSPDVWLGSALGAIGLFTLWRHHRDMDPATRVVIAGTTMTALCFSSPLLRPDLLERLSMMAYVPGMVPVTYLITREARAAAIVAPITAFAMLNGALAVKTLRVTALVRPAFEELEQLRAALPPGRNIVITRHMLRWWVVWTMEVHYSSWVARALADRDAYDAVLLLDEIGGGAFGQSHAPHGLGTPGAGVRDALLLRSETVTPFMAGEYFRLSRVEPANGDRAAPRP
jgi:hypothetical protein